MSKYTPTAELHIEGVEGRNERRKGLISKLLIMFGEYFGTLIVVFISCSGCVFQMHGYNSPLQTSMAGGMSIMTAIHIFSHISGAHVNPAVTCSAFIMKQITAPEAAIYVVSQLAGALTGYGLVIVVTPKSHLSETHCVTLPNKDIGDLEALVVEIIITAILCLSVCSAWDNKNSNKLDSVALRIGFICIMCGLAVGPYTGASMNPARSLAPAVLNGVYRSHWVYWLGPLLGAVFAGTFYRNVLLRDPLL